MPYYDYECDACGPFTAMRPIAAFADPAPCPVCTAAAPRSVAAPLLGGAPAAPTGAAPGAMRIHVGGCGCCAPRRGRLAAEAVGAPRRGAG